MSLSYQQLLKIARKSKNEPNPISSTSSAPPTHKIENPKADKKDETVKKVIPPKVKASDIKQKIAQLSTSSRISKDLLKIQKKSKLEDHAQTSKDTNSKSKINSINSLNSKSVSDSKLKLKSKEIPLKSKPKSDIKSEMKSEMKAEIKSEIKSSNAKEKLYKVSQKKDSKPTKPFLLNPYAIDPNDPLIKNPHSVNVSHLVGEIFGNSRKRPMRMLEEEEDDDLIDMEVGYSRLHREELRR